MPEGPEVHTIGDWLEEELYDAIIHNIDYNASSRYNKTGLVGLEELRELLPLQINEIRAIGKKIIFYLKHETCDIFLISSLMMEGKWIWQDTKHSDLWFEVTRPDEEETSNLYFNDSRHFGTLEIIFGQEAINERMRDVGPDLLSEEISDDDWLRQIRYSRIKNKKIGLFLMEQKYFSGIGNYLRAEILYAAKISPHRPLLKLSDDEALTIFRHARRLINESYHAQGATLATYTNPHGGKGMFKVVVYNQRYDPLGNEVIKEDIGDKRSTHWVPSIQH